MILIHQISNLDLEYINDIKEYLKYNVLNPIIEKIVIFSNCKGFEDKIKIESKKIKYFEVEINIFDMMKYGKNNTRNFIIYSTPFIRFNVDLKKVLTFDKANVFKEENCYYIFDRKMDIKNDRNIEDILLGKKVDLKLNIQKNGYYINGFQYKSYDWRVSKTFDIASKKNIKAVKKTNEDVKESKILTEDVKESKILTETQVLNFLKTDKMKKLENSVSEKNINSNKKVLDKDLIINRVGPKKLDVIIVSVNYNDFLIVSLENNIRFFDRITVVTSSSDFLCQKICKKFGVNCVVTDKMYENGAVFNKGKAINKGIKSISNPDYILLLDADILVMENIDIDTLDEKTLYTSDRYFIPDYKSYKGYISGKIEKDNFILEKDQGFGFFQLFNYSKWKTFPESSEDASTSDILFRDKFYLKKGIDNKVFHIGDDSNWEGRKSKSFLDYDVFNQIFEKKDFDINFYFDKIYCINLDRRTDRWKSVEAEFKKMNIDVVRYSAIDGDNIDFSISNDLTENQLSDKGLIENRNSLACLLSHLEIIKEAKLNNYKRILIFEDDVLFSKDFKNEIKKIEELDWKLLYLGASQFNWSGIDTSKKYYRCNKTLGTFAYAIDSSIYDKLINLFEKKEKSVDNLLSDIQKKHKDDCYVVYPNIVISDVCNSNIRSSKNELEYAEMVRWDLSRFNTNKKIAFLFLTVGGLKKYEEWSNFFERGTGKYNLYFHSKDISGQYLVDENQIDNKVITKWGDISLVKATNNLLEASFSDESNDYFVLLSESCLPIYSFDYTYSKIIKEDKSWIFYYKWNHPHNIHRFNKINNLNSIDKFYKQSQFFLLKRDHVEIILKNNLLNDFSKVNVPDEHYYINILKNNIDFDNENICYPITNVYRLGGKNGLSTNPINELDIFNIKDCRNDFEDIEFVKDELSNSLFFRKVDEETNIKRVQSKIMNGEIALFNLICLTNILEKNNVIHWITDGTLLGAIREGNFIGHDTDTDLGVLYSSFNKESYDDILAEGFELRHVFGYHEDCLEISFTRDGVKTDLFFFYNEGQKMRHSAFSNITKLGYNRVDYHYDKFNVIKRDFLGHSFYMPEDPLKFIVTKYGEDWKTPKKEWHWATSPLNNIQTGIYIYRKVAMDKFDNWLKTQYLNKITLLIKSFSRKNCVDELIESIRERYSDIDIIIVDDSNPVLRFDYDDNIKTYNIDFDSGLSAGRNYGVSKVKTPYFILLDDDFVFTDNTDLLKFIDIFEKSKLDILGGYVIENNKPLKYFGNFYYDDNTKSIKAKSEFSDFGEYKKCDIIVNFFIAKTEKIRSFGWDNDLKLAEHTAFFYDNKTNLNVGFTDLISINHKKIRYDDYNQYRNRGNYFFNEWLKKRNIQSYENLHGQIIKIDI